MQWSNQGLPRKDNALSVVLDICPLQCLSTLSSLSQTLASSRIKPIRIQPGTALCTLLSDGVKQDVDSGSMLAFRRKDQPIAKGTLPPFHRSLYIRSGAASEVDDSFSMCAASSSSSDSSTDSESTNAIVSVRVLFLSFSIAVAFLFLVCLFLFAGVVDSEDGDDGCDNDGDSAGDGESSLSMGAAILLAAATARALTDCVGADGIVEIDCAESVDSAFDSKVGVAFSSRFFCRAANRAARALRGGGMDTTTAQKNCLPFFEAEGKLESRTAC